MSRDAWGGKEGALVAIILSRLRDGRGEGGGHGEEGVDGDQLDAGIWVKKRKNGSCRGEGRGGWGAYLLE